MPIHRSLPNVSMFVGLLSALYIGWSVVVGLRITESLLTLAVLATQTFIGLSVVRAITNLDASCLESIALGFATGSIVSTLTDQAFVNAGLVSNVWIPQGFLLLLATALRIKNAYRLIPNPNAIDVRLLLASPILIMVGYGVLGPGWAAAICILLAALALTYHPWVASSMVHVLLVSIVGLVVSMSAVAISKPQKIPYGDWLLRPLYTGSDDLVFSESLGWSMAHFGFLDYASATGTTVRYHWFSLAWSGLVDNLTEVRPFVVTLHVVPVVAFSTLGWLVFALMRIAGQSRSAASIAIIALFGTSCAIEPHRFFHVMNTSNILPYIWLILIPVALMSYMQGQLRGAIAVIPLLVATVLIAKAPFGATSLIGVLVTLGIAWVRDRRKSHVVMASLTLGISVISYLTFLSPHEWEQRQYQISWNLGNLAHGSVLYPLVPLTLIVVVASTVSIGAIGINFRFLKDPLIALISFLVGSSMVGVLRFILTGQSAELYFFNITIFSGAILTGIGFSHQIKLANQRTIHWLVIAFLGGFALMILETQYQIVLVLFRIENSKIIAPITIGVVILLFVSLTRKRSRVFGLVRPRAILILAVLGASCSLFSSILQQPEEYLSATSVAATEDMAALTWLKESTPSNIIVATNRYLCPQSEPCSYDDSSFLISAVARRRVFVEGPRFVIGGRPYPEWMTDRISLSTRFADSPTAGDLDVLRKANVNWFFLDERFLKSRTFNQSDWINFGSIKYRWGRIAIIELMTK